jgi:hypothetical protein
VLWDTKKKVSFRAGQHHCKNDESSDVRVLGEPPMCQLSQFLLSQYYHESRNDTYRFVHIPSTAHHPDVRTRRPVFPLHRSSGLLDKVRRSAQETVLTTRLSFLREFKFCISKWRILFLILIRGSREQEGGGIKGG